MASTLPPQPPRKGIQPLGGKNRHVVRITVLGLAGITVDRIRCRDKTEKAKKVIAPAEPALMKAVVAFSCNSKIKGMSTLSKRLTRSPSDDVVVGKKGRLQEPDEETATDTTGSKDRPQRHVAVWASDTLALGSVVTFETNLYASGKDTFAPKSFDLTIALAEDDTSEHKFALPFGVSTLAITGHECKNGKPVKVDLPVSSLSAARPLTKNKKKGTYGYPMIAMAPKPLDLTKRRSAVQRLFHRSQKTKVPTAAARNVFSEAYSVDANGDAILRVSMEIYEKGSDLEYVLNARRLLGDESISTASQERLVKPFSNIPFDERARICSTGAPSDEENTHMTNEDTLHSKGTFTTGTPDSTSDETFDDTFEGTQGDTIDGTYDGTYDGIYADLEYDDDESEGSDTFATNEDTVGFFAWEEGEQRDTDSKDSGTDSYTLSFEKIQEVDREVFEDDEIAEEIDPLEINFFGRKIQIPICASLPLMKQGRAAENESIVSRETKGRLDRFVHDIQDDMTHVTADFFGKSYSIPICAAMRDADEDDFTLLSNGDTLQDKENSEALSRNQTFSTLSEQNVHDIKLNKKFKSARKPDSTRGKPGDSAKHTYASPTKSEKTKAHVEAATDSSPTAIRDFPPTVTQIKKPQPEGVIAKSFNNFFNFTSAATQSAAVKYEPYQAEVPPLIIHGDDASIGDLTATTHEINIATEAQILERYRKRFHAESKQNRRSNIAIPVPVAFGGSGMCFPVPSASSPIRVTSCGSNSLLEVGVVTQNENYFAEYEAFSHISPPKGSNEEAAETIKEEAAETVLEDDETAPEYKPIEMTIAGYQSENSKDDNHGKATI